MNASASRFSGIEPIRETHDLAAFDSGEPTLDSWLRNRALVNEQADFSRTYVIVGENRVVGYYALAAGALTRGAAPRSVARNAPDPLPAITLGRLAIDRNFQGEGLGRTLLEDALNRAFAASRLVGIRIVVVHAISENASQFYERHGFQPTREPLTLYVAMQTIRTAIEEERRSED